MKQTAILVFILGLIGNLQHFDLPWTMVRGGPTLEHRPPQPSLSRYTPGVQELEHGQAATVGTIWAVLLAGFSILYLRKVSDPD